MREEIKRLLTEEVATASQIEQENGLSVGSLRHAEKYNKRKRVESIVKGSVRLYDRMDFQKKETPE